MKTNNKQIAIAMMAIALATAPNFDKKTAMNIADRLNIDNKTANEMVRELSLAKVAADSDMADDFEDYTYKDLEYLYDDLEEELFSCNDRKREMEIGNLLDQIEEAMIKREAEANSNGNFRA